MSNLKEYKRISNLIRISATMLLLIFSVSFFVGCANKENSDEESTSLDAVTSQPSITPIPTTEPVDTPEPESSEDEEDAMAIIHNGWIYYLDVNDPIVLEYSEDPPLRMKKEEESGDVTLDIRGFYFDIIGEYLYIDSNDLDIDETGVQTWSTTRMNLDGSDKKKLEYGSMSARFVIEGEQEFYFTTLGDSAIYVSDFSCESVSTISISLPDKNEIDQKLGLDNMLQLNIKDITDGVINFDVTLSADDGTILYSGIYKLTLVSNTVEKTEGIYYEYGAQENE